MTSIPFLVPDVNSAPIFQARPDTRARQDLVYFDEYGPARADPENDGGLLKLWTKVPGRRI